MPLQFYKPNSSNTGHGAGFSFNSKERALYVNIIKQTGPKVFKGGKSCNSKFSMFEIGDLLTTLEKGKEAKGYHHFPDAPTSTRFIFAPYYVGQEEKKVFKGFGLSIYRKDMQDSSKEEERFSISFTPGEARVLRQYFKSVLEHFFNAIYSEDKQRRQAAFDAKNGGAQKPASKKAAAKKQEEPAATAATEDDPFADDPFAASEELEGPEQVEPPVEKTDKTPPADENAHQINDDVF